jgi:hypothetical protein
VITKNVPPDALGLARGKQENKLGWATARRRELAATGKPAKPRTRKKSKRKSRKK